MFLSSIAGQVEVAGPAAVVTQQPMHRHTWRSPGQGATGLAVPEQRLQRSFNLFQVMVLEGESVPISC